MTLLAHSLKIGLAETNTTQNQGGDYVLSFALVQCGITFNYQTFVKMELHVQLSYEN